MAYGNPLDATTPSGGADARFLDDRIREAKAAIIERLLTIVNDINADPLVLKNGIVVTVSIADNAITQPKMADNSVGTAEIIDANVTEPKLANSAVTSAKLADNAVTQLKMADNSVGTAELKDGEVTGPKLANDAVTQAKMANDSVGTTEIIDANVTTPKIADEAVTEAKLDPEAVSQAKLAAVLEGALLKFVSGQRTLTQAETTVADGNYREFDVSCPGAIAADRPVIVYWTSTGYPSSGVFVDGHSGGWHPGDQLFINAWCLQSNIIRVRIGANRTGSTIDMGVTGASIRVFQIQRLTD